MKRSRMHQSEISQRWFCKRPYTSIQALFVVILLVVGIEFKFVRVFHDVLLQEEEVDFRVLVGKASALTRAGNSYRQPPSGTSGTEKALEKEATSLMADIDEKDRQEQSSYIIKKDDSNIPSIGNTPSYTRDDLCGGCRSHELESRGVRCGHLIYRVAMGNSTMTLLEAAHKLVHEMKYEDCRVCIECKESHKHYWRFDHAAPRISPETAKTYYFSSIPKEHRIPASVLNNDKQGNLAHYFASLNQLGLPPKQYLFEYNPSIVPFPEDTLLLDGLSERPAYVASFRIATTQGCFPINTTLQLIGGEWVSDQIPRKRDYLGLLLLRNDLSVLEEVIVDLPIQFQKREDFRLFLLYNQIYVASYCKMTPLFISHENDKIKVGHPSFNPDNQANQILLEAKNVFPSLLKVHIASSSIQCATHKSADYRRSKNLNYFVNSHNQTIVEMSPLNPHIVRPVPSPGQEDDIQDGTMPLPSFYNLDEVILANEYDFFEQSFTGDRGGACCISIPNPRPDGTANRKHLWLGISHVKTPHARRKLEGKVQSNQYLSRWYAFEPDAPYKTVAVSGYFCLSSHPAGGSMEATQKMNPLAPHAASTARLTLGSVTFDCPVIHFVTGMSEKIDDPSKLIVAYGVADCASWFVEMDKSEVVQLLFSPPDHKDEVAGGSAETI